MSLAVERMSRAQREAILDAFESSGMTGQAFAVQNDILSPRIASKFRTRFP
jgi:hypothetical protein